MRRKIHPMRVLLYLLTTFLLIAVIWNLANTWCRLESEESVMSVTLQGTGSQSLPHTATTHSDRADLTSTDRYASGPSPGTARFPNNTSDHEDVTSSPESSAGQPSLSSGSSQSPSLHLTPHKNQPLFVPLGTLASPTPSGDIAQSGIPSSAKALPMNASTGARNAVDPSVNSISGAAGNLAGGSSSANPDSQNMLSSPTQSPSVPVDPVSGLSGNSSSGDRWKRLYPAEYERYKQQYGISAFNEQTMSQGTNQ